ncbi:MAG: hypothetical protein O7B35_00685 [Deltaproteobacteria bacterium]|nr:hypothetical protein [Deltaproteobacteria bacterium]
MASLVWAKIRGSGVFIRDQPQTNPEQETRLQREIEATDRRIDRSVYELYGLTAWIGDLA